MQALSLPPDCFSVLLSLFFGEIFSLYNLEFFDIADKHCASNSSYTIKLILLKHGRLLPYHLQMVPCFFHVVLIIFWTVKPLCGLFVEFFNIGNISVHQSPLTALHWCFDYLSYTDYHWLLCVSVIIFGSFVPFK